ncbi:MAG: hypothetical protein ACFB02_07810 [Mastigocoleus sp.]
MQFATFSGVVKAQEVDNLQSLCSKFPSNSQCKTYKASENISLDNRPGKKAKCLFSGDEKRKSNVYLTFALVGLSGINSTSFEHIHTALTWVPPKTGGGGGGGCGGGGGGGGGGG